MHKAGCILMKNRIRTVAVAGMIVLLLSWGTAWADDALNSGEAFMAEQAAHLQQLECGYRPSADWLAEVRRAVARGEIPDPATRSIPPIQPGSPRTVPTELPCLTPEHIFAFEDTDQLLLTNFSNGELIDLMVTAVNDLLGKLGDNYDFVGFWLNFAPHHWVGTAFYLSFENDVAGLGLELYDRRPDYGVGGQCVEGCIMAWDINASVWQPGTGPEAFMTRVALGHELEHRFAMYLPDLLDGRQMQGYGGYGCYGPGHPNPAVDTQGSVLGIGEWVGANPAVAQASYPDFYLFNSDTGGSYSYTELYLMGYVSPAEMDAGNSELRYMDDWDCEATDYYGPISTLSSADIIAAAGPRVPDSTTEDKHYRIGWIMIHLPGDLPNTAERTKAIAIHEQFQIDMEFSTLGRGTVDNSLFDDCNCNGVPDDDDISMGTSDDINGNGIPDECEPAATISADLACLPPSGTLPFTTNMWAALSNLTTGSVRRIGGHIDVTLANSTFYANWRAGFTNVVSGGSYVISWNQNIPSSGSLVGDNVFTLVAEDVTPAPYNQPPYPASGDIDTVSCTVTGIAP